LRNFIQITLNLQSTIFATILLGLSSLASPARGTTANSIALITRHIGVINDFDCGTANWCNALKSAHKDRLNEALSAANAGLPAIETATRFTTPDEAQLVLIRDAIRSSQGIALEVRVIRQRLQENIGAAARAPEANDTANPAVIFFAGNAMNRDDGKNTISLALLNGLASSFDNTAAQLHTIGGISRQNQADLGSINGNNRSGDGGGSRWITAGGIVAGAAVLTGGGYLAGKYLIKDGEKSANRVVNNAVTQADGLVDRSLAKVDERVRNLLNDAKTQGNDFINEQVRKLRAEALGLGEDALNLLKREVLTAYDQLIAKAKADVDTLLLGKLEKARIEVLKLFDDLLKRADTLLKTGGGNLGSLNADSVDDLLSLDAKLQPLVAIVATAKNAGKSGGELNAICQSEGARLLSKAVSALSAEEIAKITALCK
jgi:hypothetical protein